MGRSPSVTAVNAWLTVRRKGGKRVARSRVSLICLVGVLLAFTCASCRSPAPELYPIVQNKKVGYMNRKGEVVIQPRFVMALMFSEGMAAACLEGENQCGYIDPTGKFVIPPQFKAAMRFSEGLAAIRIVNSVGYVDHTGKLVINPQFSSEDGSEFPLYNFSEGLARVKSGDKFGFIDHSGSFVIGARFEAALPFFDGLAAVTLDKKAGFIDKTGKFVIPPQYDEAQPFSNGLAAVKIGAKFGFADKTGRIVISPKFDAASPFSDEGLALVVVDKKTGFINKTGGFQITPQFDVLGSLPWEFAFLFTSEIGRVSFSEGLSPVKNSDGKVGYIDKNGKFVINTRLEIGLPFYRGLALSTSLKIFSQGDEEIAWIDKEGKTVWHDVAKKSASGTDTNANAATNVDVAANANAAVNANVAVDTGVAANTNVPTNMNAPVNSNPSPAARTGYLVTDANLRSQPDKDAASVGIHFRRAKVQILDEARYERNGEVVTWYKIRVLQYGRSVDANLTGGKNTPNDADEGWVNARLVSPN